MVMILFVRKDNFVQRTNNSIFRHDWSSAPDLFDFHRSAQTNRTQIRGYLCFGRNTRRQRKRQQFIYFFRFFFAQCFVDFSNQFKEFWTNSMTSESIWRILNHFNGFSTKSTTFVLKHSKNAVIKSRAKICFDFFQLDWLVGVMEIHDCTCTNRINWWEFMVLGVTWRKKQQLEIRIS